jgi:Na+/H+-dicarboxylate symporter
MQANRMTTYILIGMILGISAGWSINAQFPHDAATGLVVDPGSKALLAKYAGYFSIVSSDIFLRLIKMIIAPLVFSTLVVGIGHMSDLGTIGRVGGKAMLWFISASLVSLTLGLVLSNLLEPGAGMNQVMTGAKATVQADGMTLKNFVEHVFPRSAVEPWVNNEILQIVVFSIFFGVACAAIGDGAKRLLEDIEQVSHIVLRITGYIMKLAPFAVFCAMAATITQNGVGILVHYAYFIGDFYIGLALMIALMITVGYLALGASVWRLLSLIREPFLIAFSTASAEAAFPKFLEQLGKFPVSSRISSFVLPLGYSFNLDGSMMYVAFASIFIAQAYNIPMSLGTQILMLLTLMLTSKGIAGVPRASLVVVAATLSQFKLPEEGMLLIIGIDAFLDMGRTATNIVGNSLATAVVAKWEGQLVSDADTEAMVREEMAGEAASASSLI